MKSEAEIAMLMQLHSGAVHAPHRWAGALPTRNRDPSTQEEIWESNFRRTFARREKPKRKRCRASQVK
jgi:hypothetical protein